MDPVRALLSKAKLRKTHLKEQLIELQDYQPLVPAIKKLQQRGLTKQEQYNIVLQAQERYKSIFTFFYISFNILSLNFIIGWLEDCTKNWRRP